jgi:site-specific recombinase XerD
MFLAEESARGRRPRGILALRARSRKFVSFMESREKRIDETTLADAYAFQGELLASGVSVSTRGGKTPGDAYSMRTIADYVNVASVVCDWLTRSGRTLANPFEAIKRVRCESTIPDGILKEREMALVLDELRTWSAMTTYLEATRRYCAHVVAELQYASGLRISEVAALTVSDVDLDRALVYVRDGKKGSNRIGFLTDYACDVLERFIVDARPLLAAARNSAHADRLFLRGHETLLLLMNGELARACATLGFVRITSHGFRHALGYHLLRGGCALRYIQAILGHKNIADTEVYTKVDVADVKAVFDACHPRMHG